MLELKPLKAFVSTKAPIGSRHKNVVSLRGEHDSKRWGKTNCSKAVGWVEGGKFYTEEEKFKILDGKKFDRSQVINLAKELGDWT